MANLSDGFGEITVEKVGKEFIEFLKAVQDDDAYYRLVEYPEVDELEADDKGNLNFEFSASGRWAYSNNIEGYLNGTWMKNRKVEIEAYHKFIEVLKAKKGLVTVDYKDSDVAMDWMSEGTAELGVDDEGEIYFVDNSTDKDLTVADFAEQQGETEKWALGYLHGEEALEAYENYLEDWKSDHEGPMYKGMEPACADEWYDNEYEQED